MSTESEKGKELTKYVEDQEKEPLEENDDKMTVFEKRMFNNVVDKLRNLEMDTLEEKMFNSVFNKLKKIKKKCDKYINAHEHCKNLNYKADKLVKISMLTLSTMAAYFVNTTHVGESNETIISNNSTYSTYTNGIDADELFIDKNLTFAASIVTGINSIYNFSNKSDIHKNMVNDYIRLKNEIKIKLQTFCFGVDGKMEIAGIPERNEFINRMSFIYDKLRNDITNLKIRSNDIGLSNRIKKRYGLLDMEEVDDNY